MVNWPQSVLLVCLAQSFGGAEVRVLTLAEALQDVVAKCTVAVLEGGALCTHLQKRGLPFVTIGASRSSAKTLLRLHKIIREGGYQIVDAHNVQSIFWGHLSAIWTQARGRVATVHSNFGAEYPGIKGQLYEGVLLIDRLLARQFITVTEVLQSKAESQGIGDRATLIPNAVTVPEPAPEGVDRTQRSQWGFDPEDFVVGIVARLKPVKGHTYLIDALAQLNDLPHIKLVILGDGSLREALEIQANNQKVAHRIHFAGFTEDIVGVLRAIDVVCMASLSEALPFAVLEAASYARPILATAVGGLATLLTDHTTAILVPPRDPVALAQGLRWLHDNPDKATELGCAAYALVHERFNVHEMVEATLRVYDQALAGSNEVR